MEPPWEKPSWLPAPCRQRLSQSSIGLKPRSSWFTNGDGERVRPGCISLARNLEVVRHVGLRKEGAVQIRAGSLEIFAAFFDDEIFRCVIDADGGNERLRTIRHVHIQPKGAMAWVD